MTTTGQRLVELSALPSGTAAEHLIAISTSGTTAGDRLRSRSPLASATAMEHLLAFVTVGANQNRDGFIVNVGRMMNR
jgi:hypothetical protein